MPMRKLWLTATIAIIMAAMSAGRSHAAVMDPNAFRVAADEFAVVQTVQFVWKGQRYCWYNRGWRGPGWYRCGIFARIQKG